MFLERYFFGYHKVVKGSITKTGKKKEKSNKNKNDLIMQSALKKKTNII